MDTGCDGSEPAIACRILLQTSRVTEQELTGSCISRENWIVFITFALISLKLGGDTWLPVHSFHRLILFGPASPPSSSPAAHPAFPHSVFVPRI